MIYISGDRVDAIWQLRIHVRSTCSQHTYCTEVAISVIVPHLWLHPFGGDSAIVTPADQDEKNHKHVYAVHTHFLGI